MPSLISYSPISIPIVTTQTTITLVRRDLFDARFQLIAKGDDEDVVPRPLNALNFLDAPSDLVPGVYEGGLKTWECSLDLVEHLHNLQLSSNFGGFTGQRVLEVRLQLYPLVLNESNNQKIGCGTAMPSLYILHHLFSSLNQGSDQARPTTQIHLQDYNTSVLQLVTLPNVLLIWCTSYNIFLASIQSNLDFLKMHRRYPCPTGHQ